MAFDSVNKNSIFNISTNINSEKSTYNLIDLMKFICSILVVYVHILRDTPITNRFLYYVDFTMRSCITRVAVPFFFVAAGFFLFKKIDLMNPDFSIIKKYVFRIIAMLGIWNIVLILGEKRHLWYLSALVIAVLALSFFIYKKLSFKSIFAISFFLYFINLLTTPYYGIFKSIPIVTKILDLLHSHYIFPRNGLFFGLIFLVMGLFFAKSNFIIRKKYAAIGLGVSSLLLFAESLFTEKAELNYQLDIHLFLIPVVFFLFSLCKDIKLKDNPKYKKLRVASTLIFLMHDFVYSFVKQVTDNFILSYFLTLFGAVILSFAIEWLSQKYKFRWLKYLY